MLLAGSSPFGGRSKDAASSSRRRLVSALLARQVKAAWNSCPEDSILSWHMWHTLSRGLAVPLQWQPRRKATLVGCPGSEGRCQNRRLRICHERMAVQAKRCRTFQDGSNVFRAQASRLGPEADRASVPAPGWRPSRWKRRRKEAEHAYGNPGRPEFHMSAHAARHRNCPAEAPPQTVLRTQPAHGSIPPRQGQPIMSVIREGLPDCAGQVVPRIVVLHVPAPGYRGAVQLGCDMAGAIRPAHGTLLTAARQARGQRQVHQRERTANAAAPGIWRSSLIRIPLLLVTLALTGCNDFFNRPAVIPGGPTLWQNAPSNATFEPPNARPR